jgi:purine-binding chemotaxis protein CheW
MSSALPTDGMPADVEPTLALVDPAHLETADETSENSDYVTFVMQEESYAFPMARVQEIIRMPEVVKLPLGPVSLEGLANLRGRILPIVNLRRCCGLPVVEHDEATRVIVVDAGATIGFVVDRVSSVTSVTPDRIESVDSIRQTVDSDALEQIVKSGGDEDMTKVLDVVTLVGKEFAALADRVARSNAGAGLVKRDAGDAGDEESDDTLELVSFAVDGQEYALPIDQVQEIVQAPESVSHVPNAGSRVLGVMDLRGRLLPVVSLRSIFQLPVSDLQPQNRIVVVSLDGGVVGVVMDTVREVLRVPHDLVAELPDFMARSGRSTEVDSVCRLDSGKRLVSVLSVDKMFSRDGLREQLAGIDTGDEFPEEMGVAAGVADEHDGDDEMLVVFRLDDEEYCVDIDAVQEIIRVPESLIRVPKTLDFVEGLVNLRGAVLPVVDLRTRLGIDRAERDERQRIVVLIIGGVRTGFIVDSVAEVTRVAKSALEPAPELSEEQARLVSQVANLPEQSRMLMLLEPDHLLAADQVSKLQPKGGSARTAIAA